MIDPEMKSIGLTFTAEFVAASRVDVFEFVQMRYPSLQNLRKTVSSDGKYVYVQFEVSGDIDY